MTTLLLIRHGESMANRSGIFAGHFNAELEDNGVMQAKLTAKYIAENYKVDKIYSSDLIRAKSTAGIISEVIFGKNLNCELEGLREIDFGDMTDADTKFDTIDQAISTEYKNGYAGGTITFTGPAEYSFRGFYADNGKTE